MRTEARGAPQAHPRRARTSRRWRRSTSEDPGSAADGGDLGWAGPGTFAPEFEQGTSPALKDNEISEPFQTQFGWHIVQLLGTRTHRQHRRECAASAHSDAIRDSKADEETELWLRRLRDEAYVEYKIRDPPRIRASTLTSGEPAGIGPDLCLALAQRDWPCELVCLADRRRCSPRAPSTSHLQLRLQQLRAGEARRSAPHAPGSLRVAHLPLAAASVAGRLDPAQRRATCSRCSTAPSTAACGGEFDAMVTAPVQKSVINDAGIAFTGHTEYLAQRSGARRGR